MHGGLVNIIFGLIVYFVLVTVSGNYISNKIEEVKPNYSAENAGIEVGDKLLKINGKKVRLKSNIDNLVQASNGKEIKLTIQRNGKIKDITLVPTVEQVKNIGIYLGGTEDNLTSEIKGVFEDSAAQNVGIKVGDIITKIDGINCFNKPYKVVELIQNSENEKIQIEIKRNNEIKIFEVEPQIQTNYKLGVVFGIAENNFKNNIYYGFWDTVEFSTSIIDNLRMLFTGNIGIDKLTRTNWYFRGSIKNKRNNRICIFTFINIIITWSYKFTTISAIRWRKNSNTINRRYKEKTIKRRYRNKNTIYRILFINSFINICNI